MFECGGPFADDFQARSTRRRQLNHSYANWFVVRTRYIALRARIYDRVSVERESCPPRLFACSKNCANTFARSKTVAVAMCSALAANGVRRNPPNAISITSHGATNHCRNDRRRERPRRNPPLVFRDSRQKHCSTDLFQNRKTEKMSVWRWNFGHAKERREKRAMEGSKRAAKGNRARERRSKSYFLCAQTSNEMPA